MEQSNYSNITADFVSFMNPIFSVKVNILLVIVKISFYMFSFVALEQQQDSF